jgi:hypothetical protein
VNELSYSALMPPMCLLIATPLGVIIAFWWRHTGLAIALRLAARLYHAKPLPILVSGGTVDKSAESTAALMARASSPRLGTCRAPPGPLPCRDERDTGTGGAHLSECRYRLAGAPDYASFARSFFALHELLGLVYYRLRPGRLDRR